MAGKKEDLKTETLEEEIEEIRGSIGRLMEKLLPPKDVRDEVVRNIYAIELSFLKIVKTLIDYKVNSLEEKTSDKKKKTSKKIEVE